MFADPDDGQIVPPDAGVTVDDLAGRLSELARMFEDATDTDEILSEIVAAAIDLIPGAEEASISDVVGGQRVQPKAATGDLPRQVDALMTETGQGPCLDAIYHQHTVHVPDLASESRWPEFSRHACALGAGSMLAFQLYTDGDNLGALNLYARGSHAFDEESEHVGLLFAAHASVAFAGAQKQQELYAGMATRDLIGQAKGLLMERHGITGDKAFATLVRFSQESNRRLRDVATDLVRRHEAQEP